MEQVKAPLHGDLGKLSTHYTQAVVAVEHGQVLPMVALAVVEMALVQTGMRIT
jgi:hypothetical protein